MRIDHRLESLERYHAPRHLTIAKFVPVTVLVCTAPHDIWRARVYYYRNESNNPAEGIITDSTLSNYIDHWRVDDRSGNSWQRTRPMRSGRALDHLHRYLRRDYYGQTA